MNTTQDAGKWNKAVGYAYPTSGNANKLGFGSLGCYYVAQERSNENGKIESLPLSGHSTLEAAKIEADKLASLPYSLFSL